MLTHSKPFSFFFPTRVHWIWVFFAIFSQLNLIKVFSKWIQIVQFCLSLFCHRVFNLLFVLWVRDYHSTICKGILFLRPMVSLHLHTHTFPFNVKGWDGIKIGCDDQNLESRLQFKAVRKFTNFPFFWWWLSFGQNLALWYGCADNQLAVGFGEFSAIVQLLHSLWDWVVMVG